jgi:pyridoxamine 5'-phosphate oxidase
MAGQPPTFDDARGCYNDVMALFQAGVADRQHPCHLVAMATRRAEGFPEARMVVLRKVDAEKRQLWFYTDTRSPKIHDLEFDPRLTLLAYEPSIRTQIRIKAYATIHLEDDATETEWQRTTPIARVGYAASLGPSTSFDDHLAPPEPASLEDAYHHFAVVVCHFAEMDILVLNDEEGHRRLHLVWNNDRLSSERLMP